jgi:hypothetical protein
VVVGDLLRDFMGVGGLLGGDVLGGGRHDVD